MLFIGQTGFEDLLERELAATGMSAVEHGPGWVRTSSPALPSADLAFPHLWLIDPVEFRGSSVNALAREILNYFTAELRGERIEAAWPCMWWAPAEIVGLNRRAHSVQKMFTELLQERLARVAKLASDERPYGIGLARGLFVSLVDFDRAWVSRTAWANGQRRMADDPEAPSRSYLKIEEAYGLLGREPVKGETVIDLGAAPGGWSFSAAKRGARVLAIDNGPLKGGAEGHPQIEHCRADAFDIHPDSSETFDWFLCDLLEEPHHVLRHVVEPWLAQRRCRWFVINLKFGRSDPLALLGELNAADSPFRLPAVESRIRHLFHDREEFTIAGRVK